MMRQAIHGSFARFPRNVLLNGWGVALQHLDGLVIRHLKDYRCEKEGNVLTNYCGTGMAMLYILVRSELMNIVTDKLAIYSNSVSIA